MMKLRIITPKKVVLETEITSLTVPSADGEITILPRHERLFSLLNEGIMTIREGKDEEDFLAIGGGYLETDGKEITILVSRAYGQSEINEDLTNQAVADANKLLAQAKDNTSRLEATAMLRRSLIDQKLLRRRKR